MSFLLSLTLILLNIATSNSVDHLEKVDKINNKLPIILNYEDINQYAKIKEYYKKTDWKNFDQALNNIKNKIIIGYFEYDKLMHPTKYKASYEDLIGWLQKYEDYPVIMRKRVHRLMIKRASTKDQKNAISSPKFGNYLRGYGEAGYSSKHLETKESKHIRKKIKDINKIYFSGDINSSYTMAKNIYENYRVKDPQFYFRLGINTFRLNKKNEANKYFRHCSELLVKIASHEKNDWIIAGCYYWQAKTIDGKDNKRKVLKKASTYSRTLYGQLAIEKLKLKEAFKWNTRYAIKNLKDYKEFFNDTSFNRTLALSQIKSYDKADIEIRNLYSKYGSNFKSELFYLCEKLRLASAQIRIGEKFHNVNSTIYIRGLYPAPDWKLVNGYILDKALIYALIRRESAFNMKAKSPKGARGLMQLMPRTASKIKKDYRLRYGNVYQLYSLDLNLELGQKFLKGLIENKTTGSSLLETLIAYNAGIKRLKNWQNLIDNNDPITFIESIPIKETRWFVKYILTDLWIYRDRLGQEKPTRIMLANNKWPIFKNIDYIRTADAKY